MSVLFAPHTDRRSFQMNSFGERRLYDSEDGIIACDERSKIRGEKTEMVAKGESDKLDLISVALDVSH